MGLASWMTSQPVVRRGHRLLWCLLLALGASLAGAQTPDPRPAPATGTVVPDAPLLDMAQRPCRLSEYAEPVLVLNFWAYWCETWKQQWPQLLELATRQGELGFRLVGISLDGRWTDVRYEAPGGWQPTFPVLMDPDQTLARALGIRRVPTVMVLDRRRRVTWVSEAYPGNPAVTRAIRAAAGRQ